MKELIHEDCNESRPSSNGCFQGRQMSRSKGPVVQEALEPVPHKFTWGGAPDLGPGHVHLDPGGDVNPEEVDSEIRGELRILL